MLHTGDLGVYKDDDVFASAAPPRSKAGGDGGPLPRSSRTPPLAPHDRRLRRPLSVQKSSASNRHHLPPSAIAAKSPVSAPSPSPPPPSLCSDCSRAASREAVCFIGNDGRVSACSARMALRLCKNLNCAASNPEYAATIAGAAPKKYLVSKRHQLSYGVKSKNKSSARSSPSPSPSPPPATSQSPSSQVSPPPSPMLGQESGRKIEQERHAAVGGKEGIGDNFSEIGALAVESAIAGHEEEDGGRSGNRPQTKTTGYCNGFIIDDDEQAKGEDYSLNLSASQVQESDFSFSSKLQESDFSIKVQESVELISVDGDGEDDDCGDISSCFHESSVDLLHSDSAESMLILRHGESSREDESEDSSSVSAHQQHIREVTQRRRSGYGESKIGGVAASEMVCLRKGQVQGRKQAEEWMLDHAMEGVVQKLPPPAATGKVKFLVKAFEAVMISASVDNGGEDRKTPSPSP